MSDIRTGALAPEYTQPIHMLTCDSPCGGGKTHGMAHYAVRSARRAARKFVVAQPTITLMDETAALLCSIDPTVRVRVIHSRCADTPINAIMEHFADAKPGGEVLLITHAALLRLPHIRNQANWHLIFDEVPQVFWCADPLRLAAHKHLLLDHVDAEPFTAGYVRLQPGRAIDETALNRSGDMARGTVQAALAHINSRHWVVVADEENFAGFRANDEANPGTIANLLLYGLLQPSVMEGWRSATLMGANLSNTVAYRYWASKGAQFEQHSHIRPRYTEHPNGGQLAIYYATERDWSKELRDMTVDDPMRGSMRLLDGIVARVKAFHGDRPFAWLANKDIGDDLFGSPAAVRLPHVAHGLNTYQHLDHAVALAALNPTPAQFHVLHDLTQLNGEEVADAIYHEAAYQAACRCSIRDLSRSTGRTITVADRRAAMFLAERFSGAAVLPLPGTDLAPRDRRRTAQQRVHKDGAARVAAHRHKLLSQLVAEIHSANETSVTPFSLRVIEKAVTEDTGVSAACVSSSRLTRTEPGFYSSLFASKQQAVAEVQLAAASDDEWVETLRRAHAEAVSAKDVNALLSSAQFDPNSTAGRAGATKRGIDNIVRCRGLYLDNDGGDLTHDEFAAIFARLRMVVFNSYSSAPDAVRWRCWIPTTRWITPAVHKHLVGMIVERLRKRGWYGDRYIRDRLSRCLHAHGHRLPKALPLLMNGIRTRHFAVTDDLRAALMEDDYTGDTTLLTTICGELMEVRRHGFDESKYHAAALYYAPCQAAAPEASFFLDHTGSEREPIEPLKWIANSTLDQRPDLPPPTFTKHAPTNQTGTFPLGREAMKRRRDDAIVDWRAAAPHTGSYEFNRLAWRLAATGMQEGEVRATLIQEASSARSPGERRRQIPEVMRGLRKRTHGPMEAR